MTSPWTASGCGGCPPFTDHPCGARIDGAGTAWTQTSGSFTAEKDPPTVSDTPIGVLLSSSAAPGLLSVLYHADHLLASTSLPYTSRREDAVYNFDLSPLSGFDPDEFQVRGHIASRVDWTLPPSPPTGSSQVLLYTRIRFVLQSAGFPVVGLDMLHDRAVYSSGAAWGTISDSLASALRDTNPSATTSAAIPRQEGNFVIDRSVTRGTTQLWFDNELIVEPALTIPRTAGALNLTVDFAEARAQCSTVDVPMVEAEVELSGLRVCASGSAIPEERPFRHQSVMSELVGVGDGLRTLWVTDFPYVPSSLAVEVSGILSESDNTVPGTGVFTLADPPPSGAPIYAFYRAAGG